MVENTVSHTVYINARFLTQEVTGVQRFAIELCKAFKKEGYPVQLLAPKNVRDVALASLLGCRFIGKHSGHYWEQVELPAYLKKQDRPWLLNLCNTAPLFYKKKAVTIHDLAFLKHPEWFTRSFSLAYRLLLPKLARDARVVFTVSKHMKQELVSVLQLPAGKVKVAYNGLAQSFMEGGAKKKQYERPYFLAFGSSNPRKNTRRVCEAMNLLEKKDYDLRIIGRAEQNFKKESYPTGINTIEHSDVDDNELKELYAGATALVYPSLYEGFGLPPLEALACGCAVVLSNNEVFRELYEGFAIFVDPLNSASIKNGMLQAIQHPPRHSIVALRNKYTYPGTARGVWEVMDLLNNKEHGA